MRPAGAQRRSGTAAPAWHELIAAVRARRRARPAASAMLDAIRRAMDSLGTPRGAADELDEARELLAYWEQRSRRLPRWALVRRREARETAGRWRARVRDAEHLRYGRGALGAAAQLAVEHRMPVTLAHRGRQALRVAAYATLATAVTLVLVLAAAVAMVAEAVLGAL